MFLTLRLLCTNDFIISSSYDKTVKVWTFDTADLDDGKEADACLMTLKVNLILCFKNT